MIFSNFEDFKLLTKFVRQLHNYQNVTPHTCIFTSDIVYCGESHSDNCGVGKQIWLIA
jgi:hypothetical protein